MLNKLPLLIAVGLGVAVSVYTLDPYLRPGSPEYEGIKLQTELRKQGLCNDEIKARIQKEAAKQIPIQQSNS